MTAFYTNCPASNFQTENNTTKEKLMKNFLPYVSRSCLIVVLKKIVSQKIMHNLKVRKEKKSWPAQGIYFNMDFVSTEPSKKFGTSF